MVGVDGSEARSEAMTWAAAAAISRHNTPLHLVYGAPPDRYVPADSGITAHDMLRHAKYEAESRYPQRNMVSSERQHTSGVEALVHASQEAQLVVVGERGAGGTREPWLGSTTLALVGRTACPLTVVRSTPPALARYVHRVVLAVGDPGEATDTVTGIALHEADIRGWEVDAVRVCDAEDLPSAGKEVLEGTLHEPGQQHPDVQIRRLAIPGRPTDVLLEVVKGADLLVVGTPVRPSTARGVCLSPTVYTLLHQAACAAVMLVPQVPST